MASGKPFNYMGLPKELQLMVLGTLVGPTIWPRIKVECRRCCIGGHSGEPCRALQDSWRDRPSLDDESVEYDTEDDEIPELMPDHGEQFGYPHVEPLGDEPLGLASLAAQNAGWPKNIGIQAPRPFIIRNLGRSVWHRARTNASHTDGLSWDDANWLRDLLLVSREFSSNVQEMIWEPTVKRYASLTTMGASIPLLKSITTFNALRRVSLSMSNSQLFRFIGYRSSRRSGFKPYTSTLEVTLDILTDLNIHHLHFDFQRPQVMERYGRYVTNDPWRHTKSAPSWVASCQKMFVHIFFMLAFNRLRNVPKVTFSGYTKESNVKTWEPILSKSRKNVQCTFSSDIPKITALPVSNL